MPTPSDTVAPTPELDTISSHNIFPSCPPEDDRPSSDDASQDDLASAEPHEEHAIEQQRQPNNVVAMQISTTEIEDGIKVEHVEDIGISVDESAAPSPESATGDESHPSRSETPAMASPWRAQFPVNRLRPRQPVTTSFLRPGSRFHGTQRSDRQVYDVQVEIKTVDLAESFLCGYLRIQGLTDDHPTLTTFFEGEIIGPKYLFKTTDPTWGSTEKVDLQHWARFPAWRPLAKSAKSPNFTLKNFQQRPHLFMRLKERFLVPDHKVKTINGASFEGFYYVCFDQCTGQFSGIYFHAKSEKYQQLELQHVDDHGCMGAVEFR